MQNRTYQVGKVKVEWGPNRGGMMLKITPQSNVAGEEDEEEGEVNLLMGETKTCSALEKVFQNENPDWNKVVDILTADGGTTYNDAAGILDAQLPNRKIENIELDDVMMFDHIPKTSTFTFSNMWGTLFCCCPGESRSSVARRDYSALEVDFDDDATVFQI